MTREERVRAAVEGREPDRVPVSVWMHISDKDQDSRSLAEAMVEFNEKYDYDFIKMMPDVYKRQGKHRQEVNGICQRD